MKRSTPLVATLFFATSFAAFAQAGSPPPQTQQQVQQQTRQQIYGSQLMTQQERMAYRQQMRQAKTVEERNQIRAEHHKQMQERAKARGITLPDMPPNPRGRMQQRNPNGPGQGQGQGMRQRAGNGGGG